MGLMHAERAPVVGVTIAVLVLCLECVGLVEYRAWQERADSAERVDAERGAVDAVRAANDAKAKLDAMMRELERLDAEVDRLVRSITSCGEPTQRQELRRQLQHLQQQRYELKQRPREWNDMVLPPPERRLGRV